MAVDHCDLLFAVPLIDKKLDANIAHQWYIRVQFLGLVAEQQSFVFGLFLPNACNFQVILLVRKSLLANVFYLVGNQFR
jgi:hypothetical protein